MKGKGTTAGLPTCPNEPTAMPGDWESFRVHACLIDIESQRLLKVVKGDIGNVGAGFSQLWHPREFSEYKAKNHGSLSMTAGTYIYVLQRASSFQFHWLLCLKSYFIQILVHCFGPCLRRTFQSFYTHSWNVARMVPPNARPWHFDMFVLGQTPARVAMLIGMVLALDTTKSASKR